MFIWKKDKQENPNEEDNEKLFKNLVASSEGGDAASASSGDNTKADAPKEQAPAPKKEEAPKAKEEVKAEDFFAIDEKKEEAQKPEAESKTSDTKGKEAEKKGSKEAAPEDEKPLLDKILTLTQKQKTAKPVLGKAPVALKTLGIKEYREKKQLKLAKISLLCIAMIFFSIFLYFFARLDPRVTWFGPNVTTTLENTTEEIKNVQTDINEVNFLTARLELDIFNVISDKYSYLLAEVDSPFIDREEKRVLEIEFSDTEKKLISILKSIKDVFAEKIWIATPLEREVESNIDLEKDYRQRFVTALNNQKKDLLTDKENNLSEIKIIDNTVQLANNKNFITKFLAFDFDNLDASIITEVINLINENTVSDLSVVTSIKNNRIHFSDVIANIDKVTKKVDVTYGRDLFNELGGVRYNSYNFDSKSKRLTLSGETKTDDGKNFTLIANLLDSLEQSDKFKNVEDDSFSKSLVENEGKYIASFSITLEIQPQGEEDPRDVLFLDEEIDDGGIVRDEELEDENTEEDLSESDEGDESEGDIVEEESETTT